jgi:hypothetical protein
MLNEIKASLGLLVGAPGDYYIGVVAVTTRKFSHIIIGPAGATVSVCAIRGVDVLSARNYGVLPAGYIMVAGGDDYFDSITLTAGNAEGIDYVEASNPNLASVTVSNGVHGNTMTPTVTFTNSLLSNTRVLRWRLKNSGGQIVDSGIAKIHFLKGTSINVNILGLTYYTTIATGYTLEVNVTDSDSVWIASASFNIT